MVISLHRTKLPKKRCSRRQARRHSALVRKARIALPVIAAGVGFSYVVMATPRTVDQRFVEQFDNLDMQTNDMRLERPRFVSEDDLGRAFEIVADAAVQNPDMPDLIALDNPEAFKELSATAGEEYIRALEGMYSTQNRTIDLRNNIRIKQDIGGQDFELTTETGQITLEDRTFNSDVKVFGKSSQGTISADGMTAYQDENRVVFRNAHLRYDPAGNDGAGGSDETGEDGAAADDGPVDDGAGDNGADQDTAERGND